MIRPLQDRVIVKRLDAEEQTAGGIIIPDTAKEKPQEGEVVAVGPGKRLDNGSLQEMGVKQGDKILFSKYGGTAVHNVLITNRQEARILVRLQRLNVG